MKEKSTDLQTCRKICGLGCVTSAQVIHATLPTHFPAMHSLCLRHFHSPTTFTKLSSFITQNIICSRTTQNFDMVLFKQAINFLYATLKLLLLLSSLNILFIPSFLLKWQFCIGTYWMAHSRRGQRLGCLGLKHFDLAWIETPPIVLMLHPYEKNSAILNLAN